MSSLSCNFFYDGVWKVSIACMSLFRNDNLIINRLDSFLGKT